MIKLILVLIVTFISVSDACSCIQRTNQQKYCDSQFAGLIYVLDSGVVTPVVTGTLRMYGIIVIQQIRGTPIINPTQLQTSLSTASCGATLIAGHIYFVAGSSSPLSLNFCQLYEDVTFLTPCVIAQKLQGYQRTSCFTIGIPELPVEKAPIN